MKPDVKKQIDHVAAYCAEKGIRFTEGRRLVLETVAASPQAMGAYDILRALSKRMKNPKPPTAYRAIEFLQEHGFLHRIESLNAYVSCHAHHCHQGVQFLICDSCRKVEEAHLCHPPEALAAQARSSGFTLGAWNAELHGMCRDCKRQS